MQLIKTKRLILRNFSPNDGADLFEYMHKPVASCFFSLALDDVKAAEDDAKKRSESDSQIAVCLADSGKMIGDLFAESEEDAYSVGWNFNPHFGGQGYAFEAATALFNHLFIDKSVRRIYAYAEDTNLSSQKLCEKLGMRKEGVFKEFVTFMKDEHGVPVYENTIQYAILQKEWLHLNKTPSL